MVSHGELMIRIAAGAALGGVIGYERDLHGRPVGLRTHLIVALAASTFMVVSTQFAYFQQFGKDDLIGVDASRIAASVVSAVGFLAGGAILRSGMSVQGLTTAAGLWLVTAVGLCTGGGMYVEAVFSTVLGLFALVFLRRFEDKDDRIVRRQVSLTLAAEQGEVGRLTQELEQRGMTISDLDYAKDLGEQGSLSLTFVVQHERHLSFDDLASVLEQRPGVKRVHIKVRP